MPKLPPAVAAIAVAILFFLLLPTLVIVPAAFSDSVFLSFPPKGFSLRWFEAFFSSESWLLAAARSVRVALLVSVIATSLATICALALLKCSPAINRIAKVIFMAPMALPVIVYAVSVYGLYAKVGLIGSDVGLITAHTVLALPYPFLTVSAAIVTMDRSLPMAAASCGASPIKAFWCVIFPIIRPSVAAGALFAFLTSFDEVVVAMFIGGIDATLPKRMLDDIRYELSPVLAAIAAVLTCLTAILIFVANTKKLAGEQR